MPFDRVVVQGLNPIGKLVEAFALGGGGGIIPIGKLVEEAVVLRGGGGGGRIKCASVVGGTGRLGG